MPTTLPALKMPSIPTTAAFVAIVLALCFLFVLGVAKARAQGESAAQRRKWVRSSALAVLGWLIVTGIASGSGVLALHTPIPLLMPFVLVSLGAAVFAAFSALGTRLARGLPIAALVGFQAFRLPLELILHSWSSEGVIPVQMTFTGYNFDIISGITAAALWIWLLMATEPPRIAIWIWNVLGSALLGTVMSIAVLSSPGPLRHYHNDPPLLLPFHFPYGYIIPFCVGGALFGHLLVFRWLAWTASREKRARTDPRLAR